LQTLNGEAVQTFLAPTDPGRLNHHGGALSHPAKIAALFTLSRLPRWICDAAIPRCDVFHISNQLRQPPQRPKLTTTLHDLTTWIVPECHKAAMVSADRIFAERVLKRSAGIIAISESTRQDAIRMVGLAPEKIRVIYPGVAGEYFSVAPESVERVVKIHRLKRPYFLFVGTIEPRKNIDTLLSAWKEMAVSFRREHQLVIAGMRGWRAEATMSRLTQISRDEQDVSYLGYVPESDMPALTAGAEAFVYPSLYEGFGIPVAQAMAAGCPVITSNVSSLPEITDGAALLVDPRSAEELKSALCAIGQSEDLRTRLRAKSTETARRYTWERAAAETLEFFREIA
jgi:alpha-1,3-rhamnosyl/mannosyltransferase